MLKASRLLISEDLSNLINLSVQMGQYPSKLEISKLSPFLKQMMIQIQIIIDLSLYHQFSIEYLKD